MSMFCNACGSKMIKTFTSTVIYVCRCGEQKLGDNDSTLVASEEFNLPMVESTHRIFIETSPFDRSGFKVMKTCNKCGLDYMTMIRLGANQIIRYTCTCGNNMSD